ncbi:hypothetical protein INR76_05910 [Marixanthomonas sp. SCSIO 43207]|uniref:hypothetical protein n=1 Tax=Marixanthomonas sp. SCSIO 43207 TaxID=2779360 RepID=UPI001CA919B6|nr:hypothetical protein [Marixanthomonas sp. SCSIO 43207]UAB82294.1 hypothetical protein INR76_05910 [Marixanthomonas sp. SCSIO 43207]
MERHIILIGKTKTYPKGTSENDVNVIYAYENGLDEIEAAEQNGKTEYYVLVMIKTNDQNHPDLQRINTDWEEIAGSELNGLEIVTENKKRISKNAKYMFAEWHDETIRFKLPVIGFISESKKGKAEAKKLLLKYAIKPKWKFWE